MQKKKTFLWIGGFVLLAVALSLLAVFARGDAENPGIPISSSSTDTSEGETYSTYAPNQELLSEVELERLYPGKKIIAWAMDGMALTNITTDGQKALNDMLIKKGADFVLRWVEIPSLEDYQGELRQYFEKELQADLFYTGSLSNRFEPGGVIDSYMSAYENGWLLPLDDILSSSEGETLFSLFSEQYWDYLRINGCIHGVASGRDIGETGVVLVNESVQDIHVTTDIQTLLPALEVLKTSGISYPLGLLDDLRGIAALLGYEYLAPGIAMDAERGAFLLVEDSAFLKYLRSLKTYVDDGYVNPDVLSNPWECPIILYGSANPDLWETDQQVDRSGFFPTILMHVKTSTTAVGVYIGAKYPNEAIQLLTWLMTDHDLADALVYGAKGTDYQLFNDGTVQLKEKSFSSLSWFTGLYNFCSAAPGEDLDKRRKAEQHREKTQSFELTGFHFAAKEWKDEIDTMASIIQEHTLVLSPSLNYYVPNGILSGRSENDSLTEIAILAEVLKTAGIEGMIEDANRQYEDWKALYNPVR